MTERKIKCRRCGGYTIDEEGPSDLLDEEERDLRSVKAQHYALLEQYEKLRRECARLAQRNMVLESRVQRSIDAPAQFKNCSIHDDLAGSAVDTRVYSAQADSEPTDVEHATLHKGLTVTLLEEGAPWVRIHAFFNDGMRVTACATREALANDHYRWMLCESILTRLFNGFFPDYWKDEDARRKYIEEQDREEYPVHVRWREW